MNLKERRSGAAKISLALIAAGALAFGGIAPAYAANSQIGPGDIANYENGDETSETYNYNQWHIGSNNNPDRGTSDFVTINECSITTLAHDLAAEGSVNQVLKGFPIDQRPMAALPGYGGDGSLAELQNLVNSTSINVLSGSVTIQIPISVYDGFDSEPRSVDNWTTLRSVTLGPGVHNLAGLGLEDSQGWITAPPSDWGTLFAGIQDDVNDDYIFQIIGVGFTGSAGAEVASISFGGNTYFFGTGSCVPTPDPAPNPTPAPGGPKPPVAVHTGIQ